MAVLPARNDTLQPFIGAYSSIIYIQDNLVIAKNANGEIIFSSTAGTADQAIINAVITAGYTSILIKNGTYTITGDIIPNANTILSGESETGTILNFTVADKSIKVSNPYCTIKDLKITGTGAIWITTNHVKCHDITITDDASCVDCPGAFMVQAVNNTTIYDHEFVNCTATDCGRFGFLNVGPSPVVNQAIANQRYVNCKAINCGATTRFNIYTSGFDFGEGLTYLRDIQVVDCYASGNYEIGFHVDATNPIYDLHLVNCVSVNNGLLPTSPSYGAGFYMTDGCHLVNCYAEGNYVGILLNGSGGSPSSIKATTKGNNANPYVTNGYALIVGNGAANSNINIKTISDAPVLFNMTSNNISNLRFNAEMITPLGMAFNVAGTYLIINSDFNILTIDGLGSNGSYTGTNGVLKSLQDCNVRFISKHSVGGLSSYIQLKDLTRCFVYTDIYTPNVTTDNGLLIGGTVIDTTLSGVINGTRYGIRTFWTPTGLNGNLTVKDFTFRNVCLDGAAILQTNDATNIAGSMIVDKRSCILENTAVFISDAGSKATYWSNSGSATGTGSLQVIAPQLKNGPPSIISIVPTALGSTVSGLSSVFTPGTSVSSASPSTNISGGTNSKFNIQVDNGPVRLITLTPAGQNTGALIAAAIQTAVQAYGAECASVTCVYNTVYTFTSATKGVFSKVVITNGADHNVAADLKIGVANGGVETAGTGPIDVTVTTGKTFNWFAKV